VLLNFIYLVHAALALVLALLLYFYPEWITPMVTGITWVPGDMAEVAKVYASFTAVGLVLIVLSTTFARQSASTRVRRAAVWCMILISLLAAFVSLWIPFHPLQTYSVVVNAIFVLAYLWVWVFNSDEI